MAAAAAALPNSKSHQRRRPSGATHQQQSGCSCSLALRGAAATIATAARLANAFAGLRPVEDSFAGFFSEETGKNDVIIIIGKSLAWVYCVGNGLLSGVSEAKKIAGSNCFGTRSGRRSVSLPYKVAIVGLAAANAVGTGVGAYNGVGDMLGPDAESKTWAQVLSFSLAAVVFCSSTMFNQVKASEYAGAPYVKLSTSTRGLLFYGSNGISLITSAAYAIFQALQFVKAHHWGSGAAIGLSIGLATASDALLLITQAPALKYTLFEQEMINLIRKLDTHLRRLTLTPALDDHDNRALEAVIVQLAKLHEAGVISDTPLNLLRSLPAAMLDEDAALEGEDAALEGEDAALHAEEDDDALSFPTAASSGAGATPERREGVVVMHAPDYAIKPDDPHQTLSGLLAHLEKVHPAPPAENTLVCHSPACSCCECTTVLDVPKRALGVLVDSALVLNILTSPASLAALYVVISTIGQSSGDHPKHTEAEMDHNTAIIITGLILGCVGTGMKAVYRGGDAHKGIHQAVDFTARLLTCCCPTRCPELHADSEEDDDTWDDAEAAEAGTSRLVAAPKDSGADPTAPSAMPELLVPGEPAGSPATSSDRGRPARRGEPAQAQGRQNPCAWLCTCLSDFFSGTAGSPADEGYQAIPD